MNVWGLVKQLSFRQFYRLAKTMLQNPLFIYPTLIATRRTMIICDQLFGKEHHGNGKANAFRHALWNVLICKSVLYKTKSKEKSVDWAQKITDMHEELAPNEPIATAMDLHNNKIGRDVFLKQDVCFEEEKVITLLQEQLQNAKVIKEINEVSVYTNDLVYLMF
ncbi:hypothetical protein [Aquimarina sp. I32.4]|uniref:DUF6973 domain-containing protein n=1 Tax=Aquimarina sp. I32.4 TaxID=2053903 RepID=UPI000CDE65A8|nr:hypothetical protein [Aquimarina sp. I32.4]